MKNQNKLRITRHFVASVITGFAFTASESQADTLLVSEAFGGANGSNLNSTSADAFDSGITTAGGSGTWQAQTTDFRADGAVVGTGTQTSRGGSAHLNLGTFINAAKGDVYGKFFLKATILPVTGGSWLSLGFATETSPLTSRNFTNAPGSGSPGTNGYATMLYRPNGDIDQYGGISTGNQVAVDDVLFTGPRTLTITLDFTPAGGYNGTTNYGTVTFADSVDGPFGSHTFTSDAPIGSLLLGWAGTTALGNANGSFRALTLTKTSPPDTVLPTLVTKTPADDATNVLTSANLVATFSEPVQAGTGNITIKRSSDNSVVEAFDVATSPRITFSAAEVTIDPTSDLTGAEYYVQIASTAIKDFSNNFYAGITDPDTTSWSFSIENIAPTALQFSPNVVTNATTGTRLLVQFNEAVQAGTGTVTIHKASDNSVVETIDVATPGAVAANGNTLVVLRSVALSAATAYYVNTTAGAFKDLSGNPASAISNTTTWTFSTAALVPIVAEEFNGSGISLNGKVASTFSTAITTAGGSSVWGSSPNCLRTGAVSGANPTAYLNLGTYLNDAKGTANGKFHLTMTISENTGAWISLGFAEENTPNTSRNFTDSPAAGTATTTGLATIIYRAQNSGVVPGELDMFGGSTNLNPVDGPDGNTGFRRLTVTLDLTPAGGYNGSSNFGTATWSDNVLGNLGSFTYTTATDFGSILFSGTGTVGMVNALALYQEVTTPGNTYASWINGFAFTGFTSPDLTATGDPDKDGLPNAVENLLGTSPETFNPGLTAVSASGGNLVFRHTLGATPASDLTGSYEWSADLATWHASGAPSGGTTVTFGTPVVITPGTPDLVEVTATVSGTPATKVFGRFKATKN